MPKVSVIIPVYNTAKYLEKCLESVCNQTLQDIEILCINDASPDNSLEILKAYASRDARLKIIDFKKNKGVSIARNTAMEQATGEYIGFVDSDDWIDLDFYEKLYTKAKETNADAVKGNIYDYEEKTGRTYLSDFYNVNDKIKQNKAYFLYGFTSAIYNTQFIKKHRIKFPEGISHFEDPYFSIKASFYYNNVQISEQAKYFYTKREDSCCSSYNKKSGIENFMKSIKLIFDMLNKSKRDEKDYLIYHSFLLDRIIPFCKSPNYTNNITHHLINTLLYLLKTSKISIAETLTSYFMMQKEASMLQMATILRATKGKK